MKKVINGILYSTETATLVASDSYSNPTDFNYWEEELYKTKKDNWFLVGSGGPSSRYSRSVDLNSWAGSRDNIVPLDHHEAMAWLERAGEDDLVIEHFGALVHEA